jgi:hypothetical protein
MTSYAYMSQRQQWKRPQAMLWSDTPGTLVNVDPLDPGLGQIYVPSGVESYANFIGLTAEETQDQFLILSDHNRGEINISTQRIEKKQRMINGTMRSFHIADKLNISTSWNMLPSRQSFIRANWDPTTGVAPITPSQAFTADFGAGGVEMLKWYEDHTGPFWVFLSYDKYTNFGVNTIHHQNLAKYNQVVQMYISNFDYSIVKRGGPSLVSGTPDFGLASNFGYDMWNINVTLEEV